MKHHAALAGALAVMVALASTRARAQALASRDPAPTQARADEWTRRGDGQAALGHYDEALQAYRQSYALVPSVDLLLKESKAYQALGRYPEALDALSRFQVDAPFAVRERVPGLTKLTAELFAHVATLEVRCEVDGADVTVGGTSVGPTPVAAVRVNAGKVIVAVTREGFVPYRREVAAPGGGTTWVDVKLEPAVREGRLHVEVPGNGAVVSIDGRPVGLTPLDASLAPGSHVVVAHREGSVDASTQVVIRPGETKTVSLHLSGTIHVGTWWIWTTLGLAVVGGTVLTYALITEKPHSTGDHFSPGVASEPLVRW